MKLNISLAKKLALFCIALALLYVFIFFFIDDSVSLLAAIPSKIGEGQVWRIITFSFVHFDNIHLIENVISLFLLGILAFELKTNFEDLSLIYFVAPIFAITPFLLIWDATLAGASMAIYAGFGVVAQESRKFKINPYIIISFLIAFTFFRAFTVFLNCGFCNDFIISLKQAAAHITGLFVGIGLYKIIYIPHFKPFIKGVNAYESC